MGFFNRNKKQEEEQYYIKNPHKKRTLTNNELFGISLSLVIAEQNGAYVDSLEVGETDFPQKQMMQRNWGIYNGEDAVTFMENRKDEGHRKLFNRLLEIYIEQDCVDAVHIDFSGTEFESKDYEDEESDDEDATETEDNQPDWQSVVGFLENLDQIYELDEGNAWFGDMEDDLKIGTDAWDFGRIVFVARVCFTLGYITESQAWHYINEIVKLTKKKFNNWEDYATSYMLGRAMWSGDDGEWETVAGFAADALDAKESPWTKLKW